MSGKKLAKDVVFTTIEMELAWKEATRAYEDYKLKKSENADTKIIPCEPPGRLEDFIDRRMKDFSTVSHGDVVLIEGTELKRIPGNYQKD